MPRSQADPNSPSIPHLDPFMYGILPYIYIMETPDSLAPDAELNGEWGSDLPQTDATLPAASPRTGKAPGTKKDERFELRLSPADKQLLARAQEIAGDKTLSGFASRILREQARKVVAEHTVIHLSEADFLHFCEVLANPPEPNANLVDAFRAYRKFIDAS